MDYAHLRNLTVAAALLYGAASLPGVAASDCWRDLRGREHCGISPGARVGLGLAILTGIVLVFFLMKCLLTRRARRRNLAYVAQSPAAMEEATQCNAPPPTPASIPRSPSPVYDVRLSYLPTKPPAYARHYAASPLAGEMSQTFASDGPALAEKRGG